MFNEAYQSISQHMKKGYVDSDRKGVLIRAVAIVGSCNKYLLRDPVTYELLVAVTIRGACQSGPWSPGSVPLYVNVDMSSGTTYNSWVDSLSASFPGLQV